MKELGYWRVSVLHVEPVSGFIPSGAHGSIAFLIEILPSRDSSCWEINWYTLLTTREQKFRKDMVKIWMPVSSILLRTYYTARTTLGILQSCCLKLVMAPWYRRCYSRFTDEKADRLRSVTSLVIGRWACTSQRRRNDNQVSDSRATPHCVPPHRGEGWRLAGAPSLSSSGTVQQEALLLLCVRNSNHDLQRKPVIFRFCFYLYFWFKTKVKHHLFKNNYQCFIQWMTLLFHIKLSKLK